MSNSCFVFCSPNTYIVRTMLRHVLIDAEFLLRRKLVCDDKRLEKQPHIFVLIVKKWYLLIRYIFIIYIVVTKGCKTNTFEFVTITKFKHT